MERPDSSDRIEELLAHRAWVGRVARALVLDRSRADDLEQEAWLRALRAPPPRSPRAWLGTILRNAAVNLRIAERRRATHEAAAPPPLDPPSPEDLLDRAEVVERVARAVRTLDEPYRTVILLRYFEDLSPPDVAARIGVPLETVRTRLRRGLALLRERMDGDGNRKSWALLLLPLARRPAPAAAGSAVAAGAAGAILMTLKAKAAVAAVVLLLVAGVAWWSGSGPVPNDPPARPSATVRPGVPMATAPTAVPVVAEAVIGGVLIDADTGEVVPGAGVRATDAGSGATLGEGTTGPDGRFTVALAKASRATLTAAKTGYTVVERRGAAPGSPLTLRTRRLGAVRVRVQDSRGDPVPGAEITLREDGPRSREAVTDVEGRTVFEGAVPGTFHVGAFPPATRTDLAQISRESVLLSGESHEVVLDLVPGISCAGQVVDAETQAPVPGAEILTISGLRYRTWRADGEGRFSFDFFEADQPTWGAGVLVRASGYETKSFQFRPSTDRTFVVPMRRAVAHRFRVTAADGTPVPGARVVVYGMEKLPYDAVGEGRTDESGECTVGGISPAEKATFLVGATSSDGRLRAMTEWHEGFVRGMKAVEADKGFVPVRVGAAEGNLTVRLRSKTIPVEGRRVRVGSVPAGREYAFDARLGAPPRYPNLRMLLPEECRREGDTDPSGIVAFGDLPGGASIVEVDVRTDRGWFLGATPKDGILEIDLDEAVPEKHEIRGVVRTKNGPVLGAFVHLVTESGAMGDGSITVTNGRFRIETCVWPPVRIAVSIVEKSGAYRIREFPPPSEGEEADLIVGE